MVQHSGKKFKTAFTQVSILGLMIASQALAPVLAQQSHGPTTHDHTRQNYETDRPTRNRIESAGYDHSNYNQRHRQRLDRLRMQDTYQQRGPMRAREGLTYGSLSLKSYLSYSDNVALRIQNRVGDFSTKAELSGSVLFNRARFTGSGSLRLVGTAYFKEPDNPTGSNLPNVNRYEQIGFNQSATGVGTFEGVENLFYVDVGALTQSITSQNSTQANNNLTLENRYDIYAFNVSPYFYSRFAYDGQAEVRYRASTVIIDERDQFFGVDDYKNDSISHEVSAFYDSGRLFDAFSFGINATAQNVEETGSDILPEVNFEQYSLSTDLRVPVNDNVMLTGSIGYDEVVIEEGNGLPERDLSGVLYKGGVLIHPGRHSRFGFEVGERYNGTWLNGFATARISPKHSFNLNLGRQLGTGQQTDTSNALRFQAQTFELANTLSTQQANTSRELSTRINSYNRDFQRLDGVRGGIGLTNYANLGLSGGGRRTNYFLRANAVDSNQGFQERTTFGLNGLVNRALTRHRSVYLSSSYEFEDVDVNLDPNACFFSLINDPAFANSSINQIIQLCVSPLSLAGESHRFNVTTGISQRIGRRLSLFGNYSYSTSRSDRATPLSDYEQNTVSVGLNYDF